MVKRVAAEAVVCLRDRLHAYGELDELLRELRASVPKSVAAGRFGALWHGCADDASFDCEALMFVDHPVQPAGRSRYRVLAPGRYAAILCDGDEDDGPYYAVLRRWLFAHGHAVSSATREIYHSAEPRSADALTEIQVPLGP